VLFESLSEFRIVSLHSGIHLSKSLKAFVWEWDTCTGKAVE
jgi:hypothetical protein